MARAAIRHECLEYVSVSYPMEIHFPADQVVCKICPFCHSENSGTRFRCVETGEILPYFDKITGLRCPLNIPTQNTNENEEEI